MSTLKGEAGAQKSEASGEQDLRRPLVSGPTLCLHNPERESVLKSRVLYPCTLVSHSQDLVKEVHAGLWRGACRGILRRLRPTSAFCCFARKWQPSSNRHEP